MYTKFNLEGVKPMQTISISNKKGGVGKTVLTVNLAYEFSELGYRVLVLDMDEQCNTTTFYFGEQPEQEDNIYNLLENPNKNISDCIFEVNDKLFIISGSPKMKYFNSEDEVLLKNLLKDDTFKDMFDIILIDNPPAFNNKTLNSFVASNHVVVVAEADSFSLNGLKQLEENINEIKRLKNEELNILGIVLNKVDKRRKINREYQCIIKNYYGDLMIKTPVNNYAEIPRSVAKGVAVSEAFPKSKSSVQFNFVAKELIDRLGIEVKPNGDGRPETDTNDK